MTDMTRFLADVLDGRRVRVGDALRSTLATVLLLAEGDDDLTDAASCALVEGRLKVDAELLLGLYWAAPRHARQVLATGVPLARLPSPMFRKVWRNAYDTSRGEAERIGLARTLDGFLTRDPGEAGRYVPQIRRFAASRHSDLRGMGLLLTAVLPHLSAEDLANLERGLEARSATVLLGALGAVQRLLARPSARTTEGMRVVASDATLVAARRALAHPDEVVSMAAKNFLRMLGRVKGRRKVRP